MNFRNGRRFGSMLITAILVLVVSTHPIAANAEIFGIHAGSTGVPPVPATVVDIDPSSGADSVPAVFASCNSGSNPVNTLFSAGFVSGLAINGVIYGVEFDGSDLFLITIEASPVCAIASRVGSNPVGFGNLESLVYVPSDGVFYSVDYDFPNHLGQLIQIDPTTGLGSAVDQHMSFDVRVTGLAYYRATEVLYGITSGTGTRVPELLMIDRTNGVETVVGATNAPLNSHESLVLDTSVNPSRLLSAGTTLNEINRSTGVATLIGGSYPRTVYGLTVIDTDGDGYPDDQDAFPNDPNEWQDTDEDGVGDNSDVFPLDPTEAFDSDGDGVGDNSDVFPLDPTRWQFSALLAIENLDGQGASGLGLSLWNSSAARHFVKRVESGTGSQVNEVSLTPDVVRAVESVTDLNGNGVDEVVVLSVNGSGFVEAKIKDGQTGELLSKLPFEADYDPLWLRVVPDSGNDGSVDIAVLGVNSLGRPRAQVRDALSGALVSKVYFDPAYTPFGFEVIEDLNGDGSSEIAVIGVDDVGRVRAQVKDVVSGQLSSLVYFDRNYTPSHVTGVDMDGNGHADALAVLGENGGIVRAQVKDVATANRLGIVRFESGYTSHKLIAMPDVNVSGSPELALLQRNESGDTRVQVKDAVTGQPVSLVSFNGSYQPRDVVLVPDVDDNSYPEIGFLGEAGVGNYLLQIKDAVTGQPQVYQPIN